MKKKSFIVAALLAAQMAQAGSHVLVVKGGVASPDTNTEVFVDATIVGDVITICPAKDVTTVIATVLDEKGVVISQEYIPATIGGVYHVLTPSLPHGCVFTLSDGTDTIYYRIDF